MPSSFIPESHLAASVARKMAKFHSRFAALDSQLRQQGKPDSLSWSEGKASSASPLTAPIPVGSPQRQIQALERLLMQVTASRNELAVSRDALSVAKGELEAENQELEMRCEALQEKIDRGASKAEEETSRVCSTQMDQVRVITAICSFPLLIYHIPDLLES